MRLSRRNGRRSPVDRGLRKDHAAAVKRAVGPKLLLLFAVIGASAMLAFSAVAAPSPMGARQDGSSRDIYLRVTPNEVVAGEKIRLRVLSPGETRVQRGSTSFLDRMDASGDWQHFYVLYPEGPERCGKRGCFVFGVGLLPGTPDIVPLPQVPPGDYRISKEVVVGPERRGVDLSRLISIAAARR